MIPFPEPGRYFVVKTRGFVPFWIRLLTRSRYDHAGIIVNTAGDTVEAEPTGALIGNIGAYAGLPLLVDTAESMTDAQRDAVIAAARGYINTPYAFLDIVRLALASLGIRWRWLTAEADAENAMVCSTLVAAVGLKAGLVGWLCGEAAPSLVRPADLAKRDGMQPWPPTPGQKR